jgi:hypothetical protein
MPVSLSDHHDERRTARSQARRSRNFVDRNYMCLRATPLFGDSTPHLASPPTVFNSSARKASSPFIGILHTGEVQGSIPCAPTTETRCFIGFSPSPGTSATGSYRQNRAETRHLDAWKIRGMRSWDVRGGTRSSKTKSKVQCLILEFTSDLDGTTRQSGLFGLVRRSKYLPNAKLPALATKVRLPTPCPSTACYWL